MFADYAVSFPPPFFFLEGSFMDDRLQGVFGEFSSFICILMGVLFFRLSFLSLYNYIFYI